jgi:histidine ammonia-lyase
MSHIVEMGAAPLSAGALTEIARTQAVVALAPEARETIVSSYAALKALVSGGAAIYGISTGLGAAVDIRISQPDAAAQERVALARSVGVGRHARQDEVRAMMAARIARLARGRSGASPEAVDALLSLLNRGVHPVVPMTGSVGAADLAPLAHIASVLIGAGEAEYEGEVLPGAEALARAGLHPLHLKGKDGLALVSSNAAAVGLAALVISDARPLLAGLLAAAALSFEGYRATLAPLSPRAVELHPVPGQAWVAETLLKAFAGGDLVKPGASRRLQDPLSFRCVGPVYGALVRVLAAALAQFELELNSSDDNPAILPGEGLSQPTANFDTTHLALAFESLGLAMARVAAACGERIMKLMSPASSDLPRFLSPVEGQSGFSTVQKTVSALTAEIQHRAMPMPVVLMPVADRVEDYGTMALAIVEKTGEIVARLRLLAAIELMVAAQACDLRAGITLGNVNSVVHNHVRSVVAPLRDDRPTSADIVAIEALIRRGVFDPLFPWPSGAH